MNYGLYTSAAGALVAMHRHTVLSNNLANVNTPGFKPDAVEIREREPARVERSALDVEPNWLLERLGGPVFAEPTRVSLEQGAVTRTEGSLDLAITGDGFFVVRTADQAQETDGADARSLRLTRDGRFALDQRGRMVLAASGEVVLDEQNRPIKLDSSTPVHIDESGAIVQNDRRIARLKLVAPDARDLVKAGGSLLRLAEGAPLPTREAPGFVRQGFVEASAVDPIETLNDIMNAAKLANTNLLLMQYHDHVLGQAFNTFGRVA